MDFVLLSLGCGALIVVVLVLVARAYPGSGADLVDWRPTRSYEDEARLESEDIQHSQEWTMPPCSDCVPWPGFPAALVWP